MKNKLLAMGMTGVLCLGFPVKVYGAEMKRQKMLLLYLRAQSRLQQD